MLRWVFSLIRSLVNRALRLFGISFQAEVEYKLRVHVKTVDGKSFLVDLNPKWNIGQVKKCVAPKVGIQPDQISIIFAGKDLADTALIEDCDLGQHSFLHAVKLKVVNKNDLPNADQSKCSTVVKVHPMCETLLDLQLTSEEREALLKSLDYAAPDYKKKIASFYVFCESPCSSIQKGKLRVRCSDCKVGAFTVDRDPCCWEDVLKPHQVSGTCQVDTCANAWAEFYFKCAQHLSRGEGDSAVPLCLIKSNFKQVLCLACMDISDPVLVFSCSDGHVICLDCFKQYCKSRLDERRFVWNSNIGYTLPCPAGCENSFIEEISHFRVLENGDYSRYLHFGAEEYVLSSGGLLCPQPGCGMGLLPDPDCRRVQCVAGCGFVFCRFCLQGYHIGDCLNIGDGNSNLATITVPYAVNPERAAQARWDADSRTTIRITSKPCPKCRTPTERDGGCMHMTCTRPQCEFHWCWICQTEWTRECMSSHWFS